MLRPAKPCSTPAGATLRNSPSTSSWRRLSSGRRNSSSAVISRWPTAIRSTPAPNLSVRVRPCPSADNRQFVLRAALVRRVQGDFGADGGAFAGGGGHLEPAA